MRNRRESVTRLLFGAALAVLVLTGCRAFQPEAVVVNKAPETFIIGAPLEDGGGYYRFHVFWYGSDVDGRVERFIWALTDTSVQDDDTTDDEEDVRFNPALDASTMEIGFWTTKTDSIFNFRIDQGEAPSYDMTLHMVAVDDYGDFDRTPARLHFFSNTLGNPIITFFQVVNDSMIAVPLGQADTVGFGVRYHVHWEGVSPNIRGYSRKALALVDTVPDYRDVEDPPMMDGMLGFKYRLMGDLGGNCVPSLEDCWMPRKYNEATGDSFSVFVLHDRNGNLLPPIQDLIFRNETPDGGVFEKLLPSGAVNMEVNSIDVSGVEVSNFMRPFTFVVNFDPETIMLDGETDWAHPEDPESYPYYILLNDATQTHYPFQSGDLIPDRTYVVVKALARDNPKDNKLDTNFKIGVSGFLQGDRQNFFGGNFRFSSESSALNTDPPWDATCDTCWYADTLGFLTGPSTTFTINMQAVDEHGRKDGSPSSLNFDVGYPPCIQCIEVLPKSSTPSEFDETLECVADTSAATVEAHPCFGDTKVLRITENGFGDDDLQFIREVFMLVDKSTGFVRVVSESGQAGARNFEIQANLYQMEILLHGLDDVRERWERKDRRMMAWAYQVDYVCDPFNQIRDGGGNDDLKQPTWGRASNRTGLEVDSATGLWKISVEVAVPRDLILLGVEDFKDVTLRYIVGIEDEEMRERVFNDATKQFGKGRVQAVAMDQTQCGFAPIRPARFNFFRQVRPSVAELPAGMSWRDCTLKSDNIIPGIQLDLDISPGAMSSLDSQPVSQYFRIIVETLKEEFECHEPAGF